MFSKISCNSSQFFVFFATNRYNKKGNDYKANLNNQIKYNLLQILNLYAEARADFESILLENESFVPALKGFAETCILHARYYRMEQMTGLARDSAQCALDKLTE